MLRTDRPGGLVPRLPPMGKPDISRPHIGTICKMKIHPGLPGPAAGPRHGSSSFLGLAWPQVQMQQPPRHAYGIIAISPAARPPARGSAQLESTMATAIVPTAIAAVVSSREDFKIFMTLGLWSPSCNRRLPLSAPPAPDLVSLDALLTSVGCWRTGEYGRPQNFTGT
ncbi:hypothetical protein G7046_g2558 [Stylonectria norvegica]|nr:hypothetical protein G7046_g2558 [Stylonectria norvegica]